MSWHIDPPTWRAYASGRLDPAAEAAVETHVTACVDCRSEARVVVEPDLGALWSAVHAEITTPRLSRPLRALAALGVPEDDLVLLAASRDLLLSWSVAVGAAVVCALVTGLVPPPFPGGSPALFLVLAPLVPVLAVVAAFDATDPLREVIEVSPFSALRLALLRTAAALTAAVPLTLAVALAVPVLHGYFATWLLPGLVLTVTTLVLLGRLPAWVASGVVGVGWVVVATVLAGNGALDAVASVAGQVAFAVALVALAALFVRISTTQPTRGVVR